MYLFSTFCPDRYLAIECLPCLQLLTPLRYSATSRMGLCCSSARRQDAWNIVSKSHKYLLHRPRLNITIRPRIFERGAEDGCLRLVVGKMPRSKHGQVHNSTSPLTLPLSPHYARVLAELARERGFDGYLLNFECPLLGGLEQTRALSAWITVLQSEILARVGPHGETHWFVVIPQCYLAL